MTRMCDPASAPDPLQGEKITAILQAQLPGVPAEEHVSDDIGNVPVEAEDDVTAAYRAHYPLLAYLARRRFDIPPEEVEAMVHEVFVAFLRNRTKVADVRAWLVGAISNRSRLYWRSKGREDAAMRQFEDSACIAVENVVAQLDLAAALRRMNPRCREVLWFRFVESLSSADIAARYGTTAGYARKLVYRCATTVRELLSGGRRSS